MIRPLNSTIYDSNDIYEHFNVQGRKNFDSKPELCPLCGSHKIGAVELLGVKTGPFFWECERCSSRFLRYTYKETNRYLKKAEELFYDLENLETIWQEQPN